jgi:hypothetical protein
MLGFVEAIESGKVDGNFAVEGPPTIQVTLLTMHATPPFRTALQWSKRP